MDGHALQAEHGRFLLSELGQLEVRFLGLDDDGLLGLQHLQHALAVAHAGDLGQLLDEARWRVDLQQLEDLEVLEVQPPDHHHHRAVGQQLAHLLGHQPAELGGATHLGRGLGEADEGVGVDLHASGALARSLSPRLRRGVSIWPAGYRPAIATG